MSNSINTIIATGKFANREMPRRRTMNDNVNDDFIAIDFETMTRYGSSACAIGMIKVIDGCIADMYFSLINPVRDEFTDSEPNFNIHGISLAECEKANTFAEQFEHIRNFIGPWKILCHNAGADIHILNECMEIYGLSGIDTSSDNVIDTYALTKKSLKNLCEQYGVDLNKHHNPLFDADATARCYLHMIGCPIYDYESVGFFRDARRVVSSEHRGFKDKELCVMTDTVFNNKRIVITGVFGKYPMRDKLVEMIQNLGGRCTSAISNKTDIVIVGEGCGPSKLKKIEELTQQGKEINVMNEDTLCSYLTQYNIV